MAGEGRLFWTDGHRRSLRRRRLSRDLCSEGKSHTACEETGRRRQGQRAEARPPWAWRETEQTQGAGEQRLVRAVGGGGAQGCSKKSPQNTEGMRPAGLQGRPHLRPGSGLPGSPAPWGPGGRLAPQPVPCCDLRTAQAGTLPTPTDARGDWHEHLVLKMRTQCPWSPWH